jgi:hypothetical protein
MAKEHLQFQISLPPTQTHELCRQVIAERRWFVDELGPMGMTARDGGRASVVKASPISIRISLQETGENTMISLDGKFPGKMGPWARKDIMKRLVAFRETMEFEASQKHHGGS